MLFIALDKEKKGISTFYGPLFWCYDSSHTRCEENLRILEVTKVLFIFIFWPFKIYHNSSRTIHWSLYHQFLT